MLSDQIPGEKRNYLATQVYNDEATHTIYPHEFIRTRDYSGMPSYSLELKRDMIVMCTRNIAPELGLQNGIKLMIRNLYNFQIEAEILTGTKYGETVFIPRIPFKSQPTKHGLDFTRTQFPIKICYAMTINKAQGQSLDRLGIFLPQPVFGHGQLYTAMSRCGV
jgi:hypothetical protein